ncbi:GNAT family N-acetyltransferase [uncultured Litoreibacter sp.]|uniref:GNAT family N-acetyltransferase n=1 Tax=uncultured Litoreibacter sp. TaxID=1392394 RepID=UPI00261CFFCC|nr:GNAT family N-acetyltransferase [uncultured Litoreibacter sp.]
MIVEAGDPKDPQATALLKQSHALMQDLFEPEENYFLDINELCASNIRFLVARDGETITGTAALAIKSGYAEVKSMFVDPDRRGQGIADRLMEALDQTAKAEGIKTLKLETAHKLAAAVKLYARHGYTECALFGDYEPNQTSLFMEKHL